MAISQLLNSLIFAATLSIAVLFTAGTATSSHSSLVASPNTIVADGVATMSTFTARDAYNNPATNAIVSLTATGTSNVFGTASGPTDANGQFTTTLSSSVAQTKTVTATFGSNDTVSCTVSFVAGPASAAGSSFVVNPNTAVANNSATLTAVLILRDAQSNPIAGTTPNFAASGASTSVLFSGATSATGQATASYKTSLAQNENAVVTAGGVTLIAPMVFTPGPAFVATSSLVVSPNSTIANNSNTLTAVLTLRDAQSNPIVGAAPSFLASGSSTTITSSGNTSASGQASATYQTSLAQNENASVTVGGITLSAPMSFVAGAASASASSLVVNPNSTTANNSNSLTAVLILRDAQSNPIAGATPSFSASGSSTTIIASGNTSVSGQASASYKSSLAQNENAVVTAGGLTLSTPIVYVAGPAAMSTSSLVASPNSTIANNSNTVTAVLILRDAQNNPIAGATPSFSASGSSTTLTPSGNTSAGGQASALYKTSLAQNENAMVSVAGLTYTTRIIFTAGPATAVTSSLIVNPNSTTANNSNMLTAVLTLRDAQNNPIAGAMPSFSASGLSTTVTASGNTSVSGTASATYKTTLAQNENAIVPQPQASR
ncbi:hypothetical protein Q3G72_006238 [Acer saccharum]|nr:hypothetical protein Q3G72_006238 [Acer saccharum]